MLKCRTDLIALDDGVSEESSHASSCVEEQEIASQNTRVHACNQHESCASGRYFVLEDFARQGIIVHSRVPSRQRFQVAKKIRRERSFVGSFTSLAMSQLNTEKRARLGCRLGLRRGGGRCVQLLALARSRVDIRRTSKRSE